MKIKCQTAMLHTAFQLAGSVVQQRPTRPILADVLLCAEKGRVELGATDLEIGIRLDVQGAEIIEEGRLAVPQARVASILRETADETVEIRSEDGHCVITGSDSEFRLPTEVAEEFPEFPAFEEDKAYVFDRKDFVEMVTKTSFAAHKGKHRYALNGVLVVIRPNKVEMVATDGRRLAHIEKKSKNRSGADESVIVPTKALDEIIKALVDEDDKIRLSIGENQIVAKTQRATVSTRLVEGHFPPYDSVIPKDNDKKVDLGRERFYSAVRRAALVTSQDSSSVTLAFGNNELEVRSSAPETGEARVKLPIEYAAGDVQISFNPEFLTDFLRVLEEESVRMEFRDSASAGLLRAGKDFLYVVMPVSRE
ncbi:MAG TPA: DNA polymerase III subunit beta [Planctomycetota bacterium]|nr:DNA polymerase III subunit beta [Planctomycetota bacterium]